MVMSARQVTDGLRRPRKSARMGKCDSRVIGRSRRGCGRSMLCTRARRWCGGAVEGSQLVGLGLVTRVDGVALAETGVRCDDGIVFAAHAKNGAAQSAIGLAKKPRGRAVVGGHREA